MLDMLRGLSTLKYAYFVIRALGKRRSLGDIMIEVWKNSIISFQDNS